MSPYLHQPVLLSEVLNQLEIKPNGVYLDGTCGEGGHTEAMARRLSSSGTIIALDRDPEILEKAKKRLSTFPCKKVFAHLSFREIDRIIQQGTPAPDGILLDLGLSSYHLKSSRGFSFQEDAPLDMRFDPRSELTAGAVINTYTEKQLAGIFHTYGEEKKARHFARKITRARKKSAIETSRQLAEIVKKGEPGSRIHPATRVFLALRLYVNNDLQELEEGLMHCFNALRPGGNLCVISFHSLEDRIVKHAFRSFQSQGLGMTKTKKPVVPQESEIKRNPRSRSAKLRAIKKRG